MQYRIHSFTLTLQIGVVMSVKRKNEVPKIFLQDPDRSLSPTKWLKSILEPLGSMKPDHLAIIALPSLDTEDVRVELSSIEISVDDDVQPDIHPCGNLLNSRCSILQYTFPDFKLQNAILPQKTPTMYFKFPPSRASAFIGSIDCQIHWQLYVPVKRGTQLESGFCLKKGKTDNR